MKKLFKRSIYIVIVILLGIILLLAFNYKADIPVEALEEKYFTPESAYLDVDDVKLHLRKRGEGPALFLIHGSFASLHTWQDWENELSKSFTTISMDLPGHGLTGPTKAEDYTTDYYAKLIFNLADELMIDTFYVAGNSMGGNVAWKMALHHPERVKKLILIDAAGFWKITSDSTTKPSKRPFIFKLLSNDAVGKAFTKITPYFLFNRNLQQVYGDKTKVKSETIDRYYELMLREGNREATLKRLRNSGSDLQDSIRFIKTPTLILWGAQDAWIPVEHAHRFHEAIKNSTLIIFNGAGHVPMEEIPDESVEAALSFLKE
ncbi:MAG TPA: alpha/beta hydrolase [Cyclobacteriaceae bacterium]|nr:alpha/beta hydrolase [Cyclobacteriaceae bacterium]HRJ81592.1 alpha/beta hydrolase [Cyclobacteriaceae bacterium]